MPFCFFSHEVFEKFVVYKYLNAIIVHVGLSGVKSIDYPMDTGGNDSWESEQEQNKGAYHW